MLNQYIDFQKYLLFMEIDLLSSLFFVSNLKSLVSSVAIFYQNIKTEKGVYDDFLPLMTFRLDCSKFSPGKTSLSSIFFTINFIFTI